MKKQILRKKTRAYALKNAIAHDGKSQMGAVMSGLFAEGLKKSEAGKFAKDVAEILNEINDTSIEEQKLDILISKRGGKNDDYWLVGGWCRY